MSIVDTVKELLNMRPSVGRIVHFVQQNSPEHLPAVVTHVNAPGFAKSDPAVDGTLLNLGLWDPRGNPTPGLEGVPEDQTAQRVNSWHWPERVEDEEEPEPEDDD